MSLFIDHSKRSASELLADLSACRQFRHISKECQQDVINKTFEAAEKFYANRPPVKHPNPNNLCANCGQPRSKYSGSGPGGLCYRCYQSEGLVTRQLWVEDVFYKAIKLRGFACDACDKIHRPQDEECRNAVNAILDNMDGSVKPILCNGCSQAFKAYTSLHFGRGAWRHASERNLEKMVLCWFALKVKLLAEKKYKTA